MEVGVAWTKEKYLLLGKLLAVLALLGLVPLGMFVDFVPAAFLYWRKWLLPILLVGVVLTALLFVHGHRNGRMYVITKKGPFFSVFMIFAAPLLLGFMGWLIVGKSLPWVFTRIAGAPFREVHVMQAHYQHSRRSCDYRLLGGPMKHSIPEYLCISEAFYRRHPEQEVPVLLTGQRSALGMRIEHVYAGQ
ncbi:hypothetical protein [Xanthomonas graminis]|jgi:hypothetical protein|uniref:hypothetical protein n=1 Tax=Xanthomonas graminis TaxID=3390026 RepID=UPI0007E3FC07|nr:hypothetical protein [Xanthomonas translucens]